MQNIQGKSVIITGGNKGIGFGIAEVLVKEGANVLITSRSSEKAENAAMQLSKLGSGKAIGTACDVRELDHQLKAVQKAIDSFGKVDAFIANAGVGHFASIEDMEVAKWQEVIDTNLTGVFYSIKAAVEALKESKGYFISISSLAGTNFFPTGAAYNASKFGLTGFTQSIMLDLRKYGVKVSTIMPGSVKSHFNDHEPNPDDAWKIQPEDIGEIVKDLMQMHQRTLPSKVEVRPTTPPSAK